MADYIKSTPIKSMGGAYSVEGFNVIITGGGGGIGRGIAQAFAESGANVCIMARNEAKGQKAVDELKACSKGNHSFIKCDVSNHDSVIEARKAYFEKYPQLDVLVNNAGVGCTAPFLSEHGLEEWHRVINTDLNGVANMVYEFAPVMRDAGKGGVIINISSIGSQRISVKEGQHLAPYNVAKAGVDIFSRYLAIVLGDANIRVLSIMPGPIHSDLDADLPPEALKEVSDLMPAHRFGEPIEVGAFCVYLSSPAATFIRGVNYPFDGGMMTVV
ncbi:MAG: SDR family NAD(P)-dependent oxidoreductase [Coriobacteriales bacterium]|jgi:NAD(P)-dependent dehydrogenase (short-subunit alcohol dehydrogenase family)